MKNYIGKCINDLFITKQETRGLFRTIYVDCVCTICNKNMRIKLKNIQKYKHECKKDNKEKQYKQNIISSNNISTKIQNNNDDHKETNENKTINEIPKTIIDELKIDINKLNEKLSDKIEKSIDEQWEKVKGSGICNSRNDVKAFFIKYGEGKFYRKNPKQSLSNENYIFGTFDDLKKYRAEKKGEKMQTRMQTRQKVIENVNNMKFSVYSAPCPNCGAVTSFINSCPVCKYKFGVNSKEQIYSSDNKKNIEEENNQYTELFNHFGYTKNKTKQYMPIKDIYALYFDNFHFLTRVGITRIDEVDFERQGVVGDFQCIDDNGKTFIVDNVFQYFREYPLVYANAKRIDKEKIHYITYNYGYIYVLMRKNNVADGFIIDLYRNGEVLKSVYGVETLWGNSEDGIYYQRTNGQDYYLNIENFEIRMASTSYKPINRRAQNALSILKENHSINMYICPSLFKNSQVLFELLKEKANLQLIDNEFEDDNKKNYRAEIPKTDYETIDLVTYLVEKKSDPLTSFGHSLCIYGYPLFRILGDTIIKKKNYILPLIAENCREQISQIIDTMTPSTINSDKYSKIFEFLKKKYKCGSVSLIEKMINKYGLAEVFSLNYLAFLSRDEHLCKTYLKERTDYIYDTIANNSHLWKSEYELYELIHYNYDDALYQYTDDRFNGLILDIYVPSINTAFEYQGEQHYKDVLIFTSETAEDRQKRDSIKKKTCDENGIRLIEWRYDELINKVILDEKLNNSISII